MDRTQLDRYADGATAVSQAIAGLAKDKLHAFPVPGAWSIQQIVFHLMESDLIATDRMKRIIAMENPLLIGFDETAFARNLMHERFDSRLACEIFERNRVLTSQLLRCLPDDAFLRQGVHNERGKISLLQLVTGTADHLEHHLTFVRHKRQLLDALSQ